MPIVKFTVAHITYHRQQRLCWRFCRDIEICADALFNNMKVYMYGFSKKGPGMESRVKGNAEAATGGFGEEKGIES